MYYLTKKLTISAAHWLNLKDKKSKCNNPHGHNWNITVVVGSLTLNDEGMVVDFGVIKEACMELDHKMLNSIIPQPTAENIAGYIYHDLTVLLFKANKEAFIAEIVVEETDGNICRFICGE